MAEEDHLRANPRHPPDDSPLPVLRVDLEISVDHSRMFWKENITQTHADCLYSPPLGFILGGFLDSSY